MGWGMLKAASQNLQNMLARNPFSDMLNPVCQKMLSTWYKGVKHSGS